MQQKKSLRQLATELGVSHAYLSQVMHGKRPASDKVAAALVSNNLALVSSSEAQGLTSNPLGGMNMSHVGSTPMRSRQHKCSPVGYWPYPSYFKAHGALWQLTTQASVLCDSAETACALEGDQRT